MDEQAAPDGSPTHAHQYDATALPLGMRVLAGELGVTRITMDSDSGTVLFEVDADLEVKEMLVDNLDDIYRKDLTVVDEGIRMVSLAGAGPEVTLAQAVNALRRINEALPSFIKFL